MEVREERLAKGANAIACLLLFPPSFLNSGQKFGSRSHNLHTKPGPRDHFQIALVGAAHRMIAAINCT